MGLAVCVDNLAVTNIVAKEIQKLKFDLCSIFEVTCLKLLHYCLDVESWQLKNAIFVSQTKYIKIVLERFKMCELIHHLNLWKLGFNS